MSQPPQSYIKKQLSVDMHKISPDIHFQHITRFPVILALLQDMAFQTVDAKMSSPVLDAGVAVEYKGALKHFMNIVVIQVMDNTVAKICCKNFAQFRIVNQEAGTCSGLVGARPQLVAQGREIPFKLRFKKLLVRFVTLVSPCVKIGLVQVGEQLLACQHVFQDSVHIKKRMHLRCFFKR